MRTGNVTIETLLILPPLQLQEGNLPRLPCVLLIDVQTEESGTFLHTFIMESRIYSLTYTGICLFILVTSLTNCLLYFLCLRENSTATKTFPTKLK